MATLAEVQRAFGGAVLGDDDPTLAALIDGAGLTPEQRLGIHRNNALITLTEALGANFPVVKALVGDAFFTQTARAFIRRSPPASPVLSRHGEGFADFLATFEPAASLPYLPDVARLEWARLGALQAADARPAPRETLAGVPPHLLPMARCAVHPSFRFVVSDWPVDRVWAMHQPDWPDGKTVSLDEGGVTILLCRPDDRVLMARADRGTLSLLLALDMGQTLETAAQAAARAHPDFDLTAALTCVLSLGLLTEIAIPRTASDDAPVTPISRPETSA
ncbi:DNA-binding domain-containing protein [Rhodospira trueperi]|uniref:Putative DNA-binding domain-containing protein n=1 Tax=Rhodospira trueperi TaxID=69960 RepID=A0A1G7HZ26_9PROT|nr:putative DNA-binding domain-containing protein [Rhodospira trueperi]SDF05761.1 hypothetical protein SAMN05421720_12714 [Rhodospira trueperi]